MADKIRISNVAKFTQLPPDLEGKPSHLWAVENELDADEIKSIIEFAASERCSIAFPSLSVFHYFYWADSQDPPKFAAYNENDLTLEERKLMISVEPNCFKSYLGEQSLDDLQSIYAWLVQNGYRTQKKGMRVKKDYLDELSTRLEDLANHTISLRYVSSRCIALGACEDNNKGGIISPDGKRLIFSPKYIPTLSGGTIRYWKIADLRFPADQVKLSPEFFKETKSLMDMSDSTNHCILNLGEPKAVEVLQDFVSRQKGGEFTIRPLTLRIGKDLLHPEYFREPGKFKVTWPNNRAALAEKFGTPRKKTKFETLKLGLLLPDRLEQVQKVVKVLSGQKIVLRMGIRQSSKYFYLGEPLSASVTEALILHLKIDYIPPGQTGLVFCEVQEKVTEETLAFIWQEAEGYRLDDILFSGFQLTE